MSKKAELDRLVQDLQFVKDAVARSNNVFKFINVSRALGLVGLWVGLVIMTLSAVSYTLLNHFGSMELVPASYRLGFNLAVLVLTLGVAAAKVKLILASARKTYANMTLLRLISDVYTPQTLNVLIPFFSAVVIATVFLVSRGHGSYLAPTLAILFGLMFASLLNIFYLKEMLIAADWLVATGLITLFTAESWHPTLVIVVTFGLGFASLYVANRFMDR